MKNNMISFASYILDELNLYREYDQSNFVMNSNNALHNKVDLVKTDVDLNLYAESLSSVLNDIDNAPIQSDLLIKFFSTMSTNIIIEIEPSKEKILQTLIILFQEMHRIK